jgi:hypothetical protein
VLISPLLVLLSLTSGAIVQLSNHKKQQRPNLTEEMTRIKEISGDDAASFNLILIKYKFTIRIYNVILNISLLIFIKI